MQIVLVCAHDVARARLTVRRARAAAPDTTIHVLDLTERYRRVADEVVHAPEYTGVSIRELHRRAVVSQPAELGRFLASALAERVRTDGDPLLVLPSGVVLLRRPEVPVGDSMWLDSRTTEERHAAVDEPALLLSAGVLRPEHHVTGTAQPGDPLTLDGRPVTALDATGLDPARPWLLDATLADPPGRLSEHPALAAVTAALAKEMLDDEVAGDTADPFTATSLGTPVDAVVRTIYRDTSAEAFGAEVPDPFDPAAAEAFTQWLSATDPRTGLPRYLAGLRASRPDLQASFPHVPGADTAPYLDWCRRFGRVDHDADPGLVDLALGAAQGGRGRALPARPELTGRPSGPHGVNVVGFLNSELGIGESARLMLTALDAAGIPHSTVPIDRHSTSRRAVHVTAGPDRSFDTTLVCVNADLTGTVAAEERDLFDRSYRIGMWYWEVEDFPAHQHGGFDTLDEVWVATDFVRGAIEPHAPVPVRVVTPPLPQRVPTPSLTRSDLGLPEDRPVFLFSFDFLSTAERKNPIGLIDAFATAFAPGEGPLLVIKSVNADLRPAEAERLRLRAAREPDVLLREEYLDTGSRDALMALCDCYVSLHRSEGLGLTMAEAMAWGKPVIATGYSGNLQFMTEQNSYLVPWTPSAIPGGADPYPVGGTWAEPDLAVAARMMRAVLADPDTAAAKGARAAEDIATRHSPEAAGQRVRQGLAASAGRRRARARRARLRAAIGLLRRH